MALAFGLRWRLAPVVYGIHRGLARRVVGASAAFAAAVALALPATAPAGAAAPAPSVMTVRGTPLALATVAQMPGATHTVLAGGKGRILVSTDAGRIWRVAWRGAAGVTQIDAASATVAYAVTTDGLLRSTDAGRTWSPAGEPGRGRTTCDALPAGPCVDSVAFAPSDPGVGYAVAAPATSVGSQPAAAALSPDGKTLYVSNLSGTVSAYDLASHEIAWHVAVGAAPGGLAVSADGRFVYVADQNGFAVSVVDTRLRRVVATVPVAANPCAVAIDPATGRVYVQSASAGMDVLRPGAHAAVVARIATSGSCGIAFAPGGGRLYVAADEDNTIEVVDPATNTLATAFPLAGSPAGVAVSADGRHLYATVTMAGRTVELDAATGRIVHAWAVPQLPYGIALDSRRGLLLVAGGDFVEAIPTGGGTARRLLFTTSVLGGAADVLGGPGLFVPTPRGVTLVRLGRYPRLATAALATSGVATAATLGVPLPDQTGSLFRTADGGATWQRVAGAPPVQSVCVGAGGRVLAAAGATVYGAGPAGTGWHVVLRAPVAAQPGGEPGIAARVACRGSDATLELAGGGAAMGHAPYLALASTDAGAHWRPVIEENYTHMARQGVNAPEGPGTYPGPFALTATGTPVFAGSTPPAGTSAIAVPAGAGVAVRGVSGAQSIAAVAFSDPATGYVLTGQDRVLRTADGGRTWRQVYPVGPAPLAVVSFVTPTVGYGLGTGANASAVLRTTDGGRAWQVVGMLPSPPAPYGGGLAFAGAGVGVAVAASGAAYRTVDGGLRWTRLKLPARASADSVMFDGRDGCLSGSSIWRTTDAGRTWQTASGAGAGDLACVAALTGNRAYAALGPPGPYGAAAVVALTGRASAWGWDGQTLYRVAAGGARVVRLAAPPAQLATFAPVSWSFPTAQDGYVLTVAGALYATADGGLVWTLVDPLAA